MWKKFLNELKVISKYPCFWIFVHFACIILCLSAIYWCAIFIFGSPEIASEAFNSNLEVYRLGGGVGFFLACILSNCVSIFVDFIKLFKKQAS